VSRKTRETEVHPGNKIATGGAWVALRLYAAVIGYRFHRQLPSWPLAKIRTTGAAMPPSSLPEEDRRVLRLPGGARGLPRSTEEIREKARGSMTASGVFFGFSIAVLAALIPSDDVRKGVSRALGENLPHALPILLSAAALPCLVIWQERFISAASMPRIDRSYPRPIAWFWGATKTTAGAIGIFGSPSGSWDPSSF
jgi:hypothetical protein